MSRLLPILYSPPMAYALWRGRKTETRRLLSASKGEIVGPFRGDGQDLHVQFLDGKGEISKSKRLAYEVGDRLCVREPWRVTRNKDAVKPSLIPQRSLTTYFEAGGQMAGITPYRPERTAGEYLFSDGGLPFPDWIGKKRPGMFMMPWQSRMTLTVEKVVVERLQSITGASARAEGVEIRQIDLFGADAAQRDAIYVAGYAGLWDSLNAKRAAWATNPWVVAYTFSVRRLNFELCK